MKIYGYCRISRQTQKIDRQISNILRAYPTADIKQEAKTGTKLDCRDVFLKLIDVVTPGDTIVFDSVSRMSRNAVEGFDLYQRLYAKGVNLVFLKEPHINTDTYKKALNSNIALTGTKTDIILKAVNEYLMELAREQILIAFQQSQKEVDDLHTRTSEGIREAQRKGKQVGQLKGAKLTVKKEKPIKQLIMRYSKDFKGDLTDSEVIAIINSKKHKIDDTEIKLHIARNTYYKYKKELATELQVQ